jgi:hypothetical protein
MDISKKILIEYNKVWDNLPKGKGGLRFGRNAVSISLIAKQYYCEKALELDFMHPLEPTKIMQIGKEGHESATTTAETVTREQAIAHAVKEREKPVSICELGVAWVYKDVPIVGFIDEAWFRGGAVDLVIERKFSNNLSVYSGHHVQAQLYCLGLGEMGFDNENTNYQITIFKRICSECEKLADGNCPVLVPELDMSSYSCERGATSSHVFPFNKQKIFSDLDWALGFWTNKRKAIPTKKSTKCRSCRHNQICEASLI